MESTGKEQGAGPNPAHETTSTATAVPGNPKESTAAPNPASDPTSLPETAASAAHPAATTVTANDIVIVSFESFAIPLSVWRNNT